MAEHSLRAALDAWRADRSCVYLATCVDDAAARVSRLEVPGRIHRWWTDQAATYDPVIATTLLAHLHDQAENDHVSWRIVLARDTPLAAVLRAEGIHDASPRGSWMNLVDRIGMLLAWPHDPRVAMALARMLWHRPFHDPKPLMMARRRRPSGIWAAIQRAIVERICAIGDPRALEWVSLSWQHLDADAQARLTATVDAAPPPYTQHEHTLDAAWAAVVAAPDDLQARLVLADAYMEKGDPRGDFIVQQCAPLLAVEKARAAGETFDPSGLYGRGADVAARAIDDNWHRWLGEVALVASRSSRFRGGLLNEVSLGHHATPAWAWERIHAHRELCAMYRVRVGHPRHAAAVAELLRARPRPPRWVHLHNGLLEALRSHRLPIAGAVLPLQGHLGPRVDDVLAIAPDLAELGFEGPNAGLYLGGIRALAYRLPRVKLSCTVDHVDDTNRALVEELKALPNVQLFTYGA